MENPINLNLVQLSQFAAILLTGLSAGLFYSYDCSVIKGLGNLQDDMYLQSFQSINKTIQNPYFFISFMGSLFLLPVATWLSRSLHDPILFYLFLSASVLYAIGVFGITVIGNVPLNEELSRFNVSSASATDIADMRKIFEKSWNTFHRIRTIGAMLTFALTIIAILKQKI